jgi:hypothetical protein
VQEQDIRLFFEILRWALRTEIVKDSHLLQHLLHKLGLEGTESFWHQLRQLSPKELRMLNDAVSLGQIDSKLYLVDALRGVLPSRTYNVCLVGGWVGIMARLLWWRVPHLLRRVVLLDSDPDAIDLARKINRDLIDDWKLELICADANEFSFGRDFHLIINCACEHFSKTTWYQRIPHGRLLALESTDFEKAEGHVACVSNISEFRKQYPLDLSLFKGELGLEEYRRFLMVGRK